MAEDLALRRRLRRDLAALGKQHPALKDSAHQARLTRYLEEEAEKDTPPMTAPTPPHRPRGRPSKGVDKFQQVNIYLPPETVAALDRLVDLEIHRTGQHVTRVEIIREAITQYLTAALPPQATQGAAPRRRTRAGQTPRPE